MTDTVIADISEFQQVIDWPTYGAHVPGVIIRAHNGNRPDNYWQRNLAGSRANVTWRGFYQYLPANVDPVAAARAFQATTGPLEPGEVAILDLEEGSGDQRARRQAWLDTLQDPIEWTYSGLSFARSHLPGVRIDWIAAYGQGEPTDAHTMWQFTNAHTFPGIAKPCDASVFHGTILPGLSGGFGRGIGSGTGVVLSSTATPTPAPRKAHPMKIIKAADDGTVWVTDGLQKRYVTTVAQITDLLFVCDQTDVVTIGQFTVDRIPVVDAPIDPAALAAAVVKALPAGQPIDVAAITTAVTSAVTTAITSVHATTTLTTGA